jgi:glycerol-3-phosphate dehydrogenase
VPFDRIGIITGPCHAEEVALERLSYLTIASKTEKQATRLASCLESHFIKTIISMIFTEPNILPCLRIFFQLLPGYVTDWVMGIISRPC